MTVQISTRTPHAFLPATLDRLLKDMWFFYAVALYTMLALVFLVAVGDPGGTSHASYVVPMFKAFGYLMPLAALSFDAIRVLLRFDQRRLLAYRQVFSSERMASLVSGMVLMAGVAIFLGTFTSIKTSLPLLYDGFPYDRLHAEIDKVLHFGTDPWRLLHAVGDNGSILRIVEFNYNVIWFVLCFGALFFVATSPRADMVRTRYLAMFLLCWVVIGNLMAGTFLSAGPAFYGRVTEDEARFADHLFFLTQSQWKNSAVHYQNYLWMLYRTDTPGVGGGISAFPSVHVALITMNALFISERSRLLGVLAFSYAVMVLASSVYLGWHYAIDGYTSIIIVVSGHFLVRRFLPDSLPQARGNTTRS